MPIVEYELWLGEIKIASFEDPEANGGFYIKFCCFKTDKLLSLEQYRHRSLLRTIITIKNELLPPGCWEYMTIHRIENGRRTSVLIEENITF